MQGIPLKNLAPLGSRPLLCWCLQSVMEFGKFDSVWVSTDHQVGQSLREEKLNSYHTFIFIFQGIAECATACGAKVTEKETTYISRYKFIKNLNLSGV